MSCANHPELAYRGGQQPIIHLEVDLHQSVQWAEANGRKWAFSLSNAGAVYAQFRALENQLGEINWDAVTATDFRPADVKEAKQAEFLVQRSFPWHLIERIGVHSLEIRSRKIRSIAIPPLGSGLGGLDWADVRPRIEAALTDIEELEAIIFEPNSAPIATQSREVPKMTPGRAALVVLMHRYLGGLMDPFVTLLEVHKLMYFMQEGGEPLRLQYAKALYGPYAENLRHVLHAVEGHLISGYADGGDAPDKQIELVPGAVKEAEAFLNDRPETVGRFDRVGKLVEGFETPFGLELLATVHWVAVRERGLPAKRNRPNPPSAGADRESRSKGTAGVSK
jgi:O-acetyl-ADP-ribose deacetylase (regulator of RNase III)